MTNEELKMALKHQGWVLWKGQKHFLQGIDVQWIKGHLVTQAILKDNDQQNSIYIVKPDELKEI